MSDIPSSNIDSPTFRFPEAGDQITTISRPWQRVREGVRRLQERAKLSLLDRETRRVVLGEKPGALVDIREPKFYEKYGLEAIPLRDKSNQPTGRAMICLRGRQAEEVIQARDIPHIPEFQGKIDTLLDSLKGKTVAQALEFLYYMSRDDTKTPPEVAATEGVLFGYPSCDIEYVVGTDYLGKPRYLGEKAAGLWIGHTPCEDCYKGKPPRSR